MIWKLVLVICLAKYAQSENGAISEQRVTIHHVKSEHSDKPDPGAKKSEYREEYAWSYPSYEFSYKVNDPKTQDIKGQQEKRHGDEVKGLYWLIEPNGHKRTVNYHANDDNGFNAEIEYIHKQENQENEPKNNNENHSGEKNAKEMYNTEIKKEENHNNDKEQEAVKHQYSITEQSDLEENSMENQNSMNSQDNVQNSGNERETSNLSGQKDESQNNGNDAANDNEENKNDLESENNVNNEEEKNKEHNNQRKKRVNSNRNKYYGNEARVKNIENGRSRRNQNNSRYRDIQHDKIPDVSNKNKGDQKRMKHALRGGRMKESNGNAELKNGQDEKKEQTNNYERRFKAPDANGDRSKNLEDNKSTTFEHRIRIIHPKSITSKS